MRNMRMDLTTAAAFLLCIAILPLGCISEDASLTSGGDDSSEGASIPEDSSDTGNGTEIDSLRIMLYGDDPESGEALSSTSLHVQHEESLAQCMRAEGFEYIPIPVYAIDTPSESLKLAMSRQEFARTYGYGKATLLEADDLTSALNAEAFTDPNESIRAAMSPAERDAYEAALYGPPAADGLSEDGSYLPADPNAGCMGEASRVYGGLSAINVSEEARAALGDIERLVENDARVIEREKAWSTCMQSEGYAVSAPADINVLIEEWLAPVLTKFGTKSVEGEAASGEIYTVDVPDYDKQLLRQAQAAELALATADLECDDEVGLRNTVASVRREHQRAAIEEWAPELRAIGDQ